MEESESNQNRIKCDATIHRRFFSERLPTTGYEQVDGMEFEITGVKDGLNFVPKGQEKCNIFPVKQVNKDVPINIMRRRWKN
ncbi:AraC family transcriptional regulator [Paenibacillus sp. FSL H7-689]|nr:AraC family transcriptional regulator [Paenibacillus sp. FSL H7-689]